MLRAITVAGTAALALLSTGCAALLDAQIHHKVDPAMQSISVCDAAEASLPEDRIVGVAISGGGSRAAVFGAAALEALAEHGFLGEISHLSTVSGGSLPGAYFMAYPYPCQGLATPEESQGCRDAYFSALRKPMRQQYVYWMFARNMLPWRFGSPSRRLQSLSEVFDNRFLHGKTFSELGPSPMWMANAMSYDEARRFVFSNACLPDGPPGPPGAPEDPNGEAPRSRTMARTALSEPALRALTFSRPGCLRPAPSDLRIAVAVATSAGFPPIGPAHIEAPSQCDGGEPEWWHLADGGIIESPGTDSLEEILLRRLAAEGPPLEKALIVAIDAGATLDPEEQKKDKSYEMYFPPDAGRLARMLDAPRDRGQAYLDMFWEELADTLADEGIAYEKIKLRYGEAELPALPESCGGKVPREEGTGYLADRVSFVRAITNSVVGIPTDFQITGCDADLLEMMAHQLVHERFDEATVGRLAGQGYTIHARRDCALERHPK